MGWFQSQSGWTNIIIDKCILHINKSFSNPYQISEHHLGGGLLVFISNGLHLGIIDIVWILSIQLEIEDIEVLLDALGIG